MSIFPPGVFFNRRSHFGRDPFSVDLPVPFLQDARPVPFLQDERHGREVIVLPPLREAVPFFNARIERKETSEAHVYEADLPGLNKHEVKVEIEDVRVLCISGEKKSEKEEKTDKWHHVECGTGKFVRRFRLPKNANVEKMRACIENGALTVTVPKDHEVVKHHSCRVIPIDGK